MKEVEVPKLTWEERYRRMIDIAYAFFMGYKVQVEKRYGVEASMDISGQTQSAMSTRTAKKLIERYNLKPNVEDVIKLMKLYSCEVWGYGEDRYVGAYLESPRKGVFVNKVCRSWERKKDYGDEKVHCHLGCQKEYGAMAHELAPHVKVTVGKAYPKGDNCCEFIVEEP